MIDMYDHRKSSIVINPDNPLRPQNAIEHSVADKMNPGFMTRPFLYARETEVKQRRLSRWPFNWFPVIKRITAATNQRTFIGCIVPSYAISYTLLILIPGEEHVKDSIFLLANLNAFIADYLVRQKTAQPALPAGCVRECALIPPSTYRETTPWDRAETLGSWILGRVLECSYTSQHLQPFGEDHGYHGPPFIWSEDRRYHIQRELDAGYFLLYGISRGDLDYVLETFPIVKKKDKQRYGEFRTKRIILETYDAMAEASRTGQPYRTILNPPPGPPMNPDGTFAKLPEWPAGAPKPPDWPPHIHEPRRHK